MSSSEIAFDCPYCGVSFVVDSSSAGEKANCPECGEIITVPEQSQNYGSESSSVESSPVEALAQKTKQENTSLATNSQSTQAEPKPAENKRSLLPQQRNRGQRDLSAVAKGQSAGKVEEIRGGWRGYCPECGDVFLFSKGDAQRGAELQCARCFCDIRIEGDTTPRISAKGAGTEILKKQAASQFIPAVAQGKDVSATMKRESMDARQMRQAQERAVAVTSGKNRLLWLRIFLLLLLIALAFWLVELGKG